MAKLPKGSGPVALTEQVENTKPTVYLQVPFDEAKNVDVGDTVTIVFKGKVVGTNMSKRKKRESHAELDVEDPQITVKQKSGQMADLDEDLDS